MTKEEVLHLGNLARIKLTETEVTALQAEITDILGYVGAINEVVADGALEKKVGPIYNIFREDEITNEPGSYTEALAAEMPDRADQSLKVKKILIQE